jgi:hypothetical protein
VLAAVSGRETAVGGRGPRRERPSSIQSRPS